MDRCNLTVLATAGNADLPEFFARHRVEVVASLPHYRAASTDAQRGDGVFEKSIAALKRLNEVGYGDGRSGLRLVLVTNPVGAFLPPAQASLEAEWKRELRRLHGVSFDALYCITNMPISRYLEWLVDSGNLDGYMERLVTAFNPATVAGRDVPRRRSRSAGTGVLYDCDFNQMLELPVGGGSRHIRDFDAAQLARRVDRRRAALLRLHGRRGLELRRQYKIGRCRSRSASSAGATRRSPPGGRSAASAASCRIWPAGPTAATGSPRSRWTTQTTRTDEPEI